ncbi:OF BC1 COMPLEX KINASE 8, chloroplastic [Seminavis robusta]|uniref:OF BC1 COMPLEX KINASE 8, chloroplastic n=1 Tax=Seminavis robusta TaxID=568900 RepID=A0A9N8HV46_9STRA|nr:OF BC1 COMPLEX KINASE 8, chloroplastic [Seminavis robusta]|eukprot:Sro1461_g274780.1 OF BC1 COMPLEX KINASE 8, chloroplastic (752) ;mRNA; f:18255-20726
MQLYGLASFLLVVAASDAFTVPFTGKAQSGTTSSQKWMASKETILEDVDGLGAAVSELNKTIASVDFDNETGKELEDDILQLMVDVEEEAEKVIASVMDDECEVDLIRGEPVDDLCVEGEEREGFRKRFKSNVSKTLQMVRGMPTEEKEETLVAEGDESPSYAGDILEEGWTQRGGTSSIRRNAEVWKFALKCVFKALKPRSMKKKGASEEEIQAAQVEAATFIRDGLLTLGPTFVKLGQVISTRTDVLPATYTDVLKSLQDEVPAFSGARAKDIVSAELGKPCDSVFTDFSAEPLKAASLGQVHTAFYKGQKVAIKVQRAGLKELFDVDLKNLRKLAALLDKFDPKSDGADRDWLSIYDESERLLYLEIDYLNEADQCERFANDFKDIDYVRVPRVYRELSTPRVLTMEFVDSFKLTDIKRIDELGLDKQKLAKQTADAFLRQIVETSYFHCDPHPGNLCVDEKGNLVYYDFGMMDELKPNVREGFRKFCTALFAGGPMISDTDLAKNAKKLVDGVEEAGVLSKGADRLAVEKLARFFMRSFKDNQLGKPTENIKETLGTDLQTLTENDVFRFPSTFTFIFRAFASVEGIGKGLDPEYDIGKLAQPFIEKFTDAQKNYSSKAEKKFDIFTRATGLNKDDINTAITSPKKIAYIEDTLRSMSSGDLKIRVRSLENEKALERMTMTQSRTENLLLATMFLNAAGLATRTVLTGAGYAGAAFFLLQAVMANAKVKKFDKTQAKYVQSKFVGDK